MMTRAFAAAAAVSVLALAGCERAAPEKATEPAAVAPPAPAPVVDSNVLTPEGLGPVRIGMSAAEVASAWGAAPPPDDPSPEGCNEFHPANAPEGVIVMIQAGRLTRISLIRDATQKTERGFGVGDTAAAIKQAYGGAIQAQPHKYNPAPAEDLIAWSKGGSTEYVTDPAARGVRYEIGTDGRANIIHAGDPSIQLVEGCH
ncbi:MAG: hypothetical protein ACT6RD_04795 [Brevundimonas sp.]|uniref:hypothetical protein n=1 Tax=Brevundimonas sp. TaxID=1871086 RepID=UPI004034A936